jgi:hypothetical protein
LVGLTVSEPESAVLRTVPAGPVSEAVVAFAVDHWQVDDAPVVNSAGVQVSVAVGFGGVTTTVVETVTVNFAVTVPAGAVAASV